MWSCWAIAFNKSPKWKEWWKHHTCVSRHFQNTYHGRIPIVCVSQSCTACQAIHSSTLNTSTPLPKNKSFIKPLNRCMHVSCVHCAVKATVPRVGTEHTVGNNNGYQIELYLWKWKQRIFCWVQWSTYSITSSWLIPNLSVYMHTVSLHVLKVYWYCSIFTKYLI